MKIFSKILFCLLSTCVIGSVAANQTDTVSPIFPQSSLPFTITIEQAAFSLPNGLHSGVFATYNDKWLLLAGRTNGMHSFNNDNNNFPPQQQNKVAYVVDLTTQTVVGRSLNDPASKLTQKQIDELSVTSPQFFQFNKTLYISGGYGVDTATGLFNTKSTLTAIDIPGFIKWILRSSKHSASHYIRQTSHPLLQVTGGYMSATDPHLSMLLIFGQNFKGFYVPSSNGNYTEQVRKFQIIDNADDLYVQARKSENPQPYYRRRDLNVIPIIDDNKLAFVALSGVFTLDTGIWTVPVIINADGTSSMANPDAPNTFKQGMNNYASARVGLYSKETKDMYMLLLGGISYGYFQGGTFQTDSGIPFINQITTVKMSKNKRFTQYLMDEEYPVIPSTGSNPGNPLLFGAGAYFIHSEELPKYSNNVFQFDRIKAPVVIGHIVGGIASTLPNTNVPSDSTASPYIFRVILTPR